MSKALLTTLEFPPQIGGVANYYWNLSKYFNESHFIVLTTTNKNSDPIDSQIKYKIYRKQLITDNKLLWPRWLPAYFSIKDIILKENIEQLLVGQILPLGTIAWYYKKFKKIPFSVFAHGMDITMPKGRKKFLIYNILKASQYIFSNSNFTKNQIIKFGIQPQKIVIVNPGVTLPPLKNDITIKQLKNNLKLNDKHILLTVARLVPRKGHTIVIRSLIKIKKVIPNIVYIIVGSGIFEKTLKQLVNDYNLSNNVIFLNNVNQIELHAMYEICDIFVMTPYELENHDVEGFGTVYLEAAMHSKPVVASQCGGTQEAVIHNKTGIIVKQKDSDETTDAILKLIQNKQLAEVLGAQGRERVYNEFLWHMQAKKIIEYLKF